MSRIGCVCQREGSFVNRVIEGSRENYELNRYGRRCEHRQWTEIGRLGGTHLLTSKTIAEEGIPMTFSKSAASCKVIKKGMLASREVTLQYIYMSPVGLHHMMGGGSSICPSPLIKDKHRTDSTLG